MTKVSMVQYQKHLCKNWGRRKSWTQREKSRRGEDSSFALLFTCCCTTAKSDMLFQETHWLMAFCRETITMTASPDAQLFKVALSKTNVWNIVECAQDMCAQLSSLWTTDQFCSTSTWKQADHVIYLFFAFGYSAHSTTVLLKWSWLWLDPIQKSAENKSSKEKQ